MSSVLRVVVLCGVALSSPVWAADTDWSGGWTVHWPGGVTRLDLAETAQGVSGVLPRRSARLDGTVHGRTLAGSWTEPGVATRFEFRLAPDRQSFIGWVDSGEWWTGARAAAPASLPVRQDTPRAVLRTVLLAAEQVRAGVPDAVAQVAAMMRFEGELRDLPVPQRMDAGGDLLALVELTTPVLTDIPELTEGDELTVRLPQAGTAAGLDLLMRRTGGAWWIVAQPASAMSAARQSLLARSGGRPGAPGADSALPTARDTLRRFAGGLAGWTDGGAAEAVAALDLSSLPDGTRHGEGELAAQYIGRVLARTGPLMTGLAPDDRLSRTPYVLLVHPLGRVAIAPLPDGTWRFDAASIRAVPAIYSAVASLPAVSGAWPVPPSTPFFRLRHLVVVHAPFLLRHAGPLEIWQVLACGALLAAGLLAGGAVLTALRACGVRLRPVAAVPVLLAATAATYQLLCPYLGLPVRVLELGQAASGAALALALAWGGWPLVDRIGRVLFRAALLQPDEIALSLVVGLLRTALVLAAVLIVADALSLPTGSVVAGLGIGGLAVAFASKETLSNVFGAAILVIDRPFRRGDFVVAGDIRGAVEHVGIRSTRIRTEEDSVLVVPNGKLSDATINNLRHRRHVLATARLTLPYNRSRAELDAFIGSLGSMLAAHPDVAGGRTQLGVESLAGDGLVLAVTCYLAATPDTERAVRQGVMLDILALADRTGMPIGKDHHPAPAPACEDRAA